LRSNTCPSVQNAISSVRVRPQIKPFHKYQRTKVCLWAAWSICFYLLFPGFRSTAFTLIWVLLHTHRR